jgi:tRNA(fMet)-specific endonuclease VapC
MAPREARASRRTSLMIAAIAMARELVLVTHNTEEFSRVTSLKLEDWE